MIRDINGLAKLGTDQALNKWKNLLLLLFLLLQYLNVLCILDFATDASFSLLFMNEFLFNYLNKAQMADCR